MSNCNNCLHYFVCPNTYEVYDCPYFDDKSNICIYHVKWEMMYMDFGIQNVI